MEQVSLEQGSEALERGDVKTAVRIWRSLAEQDNTTAQFNLGQLYQQGNGVTVDDIAAMNWYLMAIRGGSIPALYNLRMMYEEDRISQEEFDVLFEFTTVESQAPPPSPVVEIEFANTTLQQMPPNNYLLQVIATVEQAATEQYLDTHRNAFQQQVHLVPIQNNGQAWYALLLGPFSSHKSAQIALDALPEAIAKNGPWIRRVSSVQAQTATASPQVAPLPAREPSSVEP